MGKPSIVIDFIKSIFIVFYWDNHQLGGPSHESFVVSNWDYKPFSNGVYRPTRAIHHIPSGMILQVGEHGYDL